MKLEDLKMMSCVHCEHVYTWETAQKSSLHCECGEYLVHLRCLVDKKRMNLWAAFEMAMGRTVAASKNNIKAK